MRGVYIYHEYTYLAPNLHEYLLLGVQPARVQADCRTASTSTSCFSYSFQEYTYLAPNLHDYKLHGVLMTRLAPHIYGIRRYSVFCGTYAELKSIVSVQRPFQVTYRSKNSPDNKF
ncbi:hypothetical protein J6590_029227 [Homalodisca vitripennis]|nr:hypothetical protein J6590_029227 [Homalodisca vitripennis]